MGGPGPHPCNREGGGDGTRPRRSGLMGTSERSERESGASGASERTPLRMYFTNVFLFGRAIKKALKLAYCRFSAVLRWFLGAIPTPVLPHWQPVLCLRRKVYIHKRNAVIGTLKVVGRCRAGTQTIHTFRFYTYYLVLIIIS